MGIQLAVCHRCFGIYAALPMATLALVLLRSLHRPLWKHARFVVPLSVVPMALDWGLHVLGWVHNTPGSRMATGAIFGLVAGVYLTLALVMRPSFDSNLRAR